MPEGRFDLYYTIYEMNLDRYDHLVKYDYDVYICCRNVKASKLSYYFTDRLVAIPQYEYWIIF